MKNNWKILPLFGLVLSLGLFAASCSGAAPSATGTAPLPPATPTDVATPQPPPTVATRHPQSGPLFVHTAPPYVPNGATPTAIDTPQKPQTSARLKNWTEQDAIALIREMDQFAHDADFEGMAGSRFNFIDSQQAVALTLQEAITRFPDSQYREDYLWQLAFSRAVRGEPGVDEWLITHLDDALNQDGYSPNSLNTFLNPRGFNANDVRPTVNLFGDGKPGWVFNIKTHEPNTSDGLFVAIHQMPSGYDVFKLASQWSFDFGESSIQQIEDHNKNDKPEVVIYLGKHSGTTCDGETQIYEWDGNAFTELSKGVLKQFECGMDVWEYGPNDLNGVPIILVHNFFKKSEEQYTWNGKVYEFSGYDKASPFENWFYRANDVFTVSYPDDVALLPTLLDLPEALEHGPAYPDFLRFRLGIAYAAQSQPQQAFQEMQALIASPVDPSVTVYQTLAKKFLEIYKGDADLYPACAAVAALDDALAVSMDDFATVQKVYGFSADQASSFGWHATFPCDPVSVFALLVKSLPVDTQDVPALLQKNGFALDYSTSFDINADGQLEWLVVGTDYSWSLITLQNGVFQVHEAGSGTQEIPQTVQVLHWKDIPNPVLLLRGKDTLDVFTINKDFEMNPLLSEWKVKDFSISESSTPEIYLTYQDILPEEYHTETPWAAYRWDAESHTFTDDLPEYKLFTEHNPKAAAEIVEKIMPLLDHWVKDLKIPYWYAPRDYYLAALTYELTGDAQKAAQIYWQLWRNYPESPYALMARAKLAP